MKGKTIIVFLLLVLVFVGLIICSKREWQKHTQKTLRVIAKDMIEEFNKQGVDYWVDYGTLLGIVRENDIIQHDNDVDVCMMDTPENHPKVRAAMDALYKKNKGYIFTYEPWGAYRIKIKSLIWNRFADVYLTKQVDNKYVDPTGAIPVEMVGKKQYIDWQGLKVPVPEHIEESLVWRYGDNWRTPIEGVSNQR